MSVKETLEAFIAVLRREQQVLKTADIDALPSVLAEKNALAEKLQQICADKVAQWPELVKEARTLNEANGKLIGLLMQHNQQALNALLAAQGMAITYGADGLQQFGGSGRPLGKA